MKFQSLAQGPVASVKLIPFAGPATCTDLERTTGSFTSGSCRSMFNCE